MIPSLRNAVVLAVAVSAVACSRDSSLSGPAAPKTSFSRIQAEIITPGCVSCHTTKSAYGAESGLLLEPDVAYENLVGISPKNTAAASAGMRRVAAGDPQKSFLVTKLHWELFDGGSGNFGSPMPLGATSLSVGQLEFVRRWIAAGALRTGDDIDTTLLADHTLPVLQPFTPLTPPAFGIQLTTGAFTVASNFEREFFLYRALGNATDIYVNRIETKMRTGSHHFLLYTFSPSTPAPVIPAPDVVRDIRNANGSMNLVNMIAMGYHVFLGGSMTPYSNYVFPDGVALRIPVNSSLDLNSHYVNTTVGEVPGEAFANLYLVNPSQVVHAAKTLNLNNTSITLPPSQRTTISKTFLFDAPTTIVTLTSHMHARGERFVIRIVGGARDGEIVYDNANWAHPDIVTYTPPIILQTGQGLRSETTFNNTTTRTILFGLTSEDEMDIIFGYYY